MSIGKVVAQCMTRAGARVLIVGRHKEALSGAYKENKGWSEYLVDDFTSLDKAIAFQEGLVNGSDFPVSL